VGNRCADHATPSIRKEKLALKSPTIGGRSVGIVRSRTKATEFSLTMLQVIRITTFRIEVRIVTDRVKLPGFGALVKFN
jgi:hypothetical protein